MCDVLSNEGLGLRQTLHRAAEVAHHVWVSEDAVKRGGVLRALRSYGESSGEEDPVGHLAVNDGLRVPRRHADASRRGRTAGRGTTGRAWCWRVEAEHKRAPSRLGPGLG